MNKDPLATRECEHCGTHKPCDKQYCPLSGYGWARSDTQHAIEMHRALFERDSIKTRRAAE